MTKSGEDKNFYDLIIDLIYKPMFLGYSSRINSTIVASELLDLSCAGSRMLTNLIQQL